MSNSSDKVFDGCQRTCVFTFIVAGNTIGSRLQTTVYIVLSSTYLLYNQFAVSHYVLHRVPLKLNPVMGIFLNNIHKFYEYWEWESLFTASARTKFYWIRTSSMTPAERTSPNVGQRFDLCAVRNGVALPVYCSGTVVKI